MTRRSGATDFSAEGCRDFSFIRSSPVMKTSLFLGSALGVLLLSGAASAAVTNYKATINAAQETPDKSTSTAKGSGTFQYDDQTKKFTGTITFEGDFTPTQGQHVHKGAC